MSGARPLAEGSPLLGREPVLERLREHLDRCRAGVGGLVLLRGEAGIGKTRLLAEVAARAEGCLVLRAGGWEDSGTPAFWLWTQVLRAAAEAVPVEEWDERARLARSLLDAAPAATEDEAGRFPLFDAVNGVLDLLCRRRPVVLVLDDLHWVDAGSLRLLRFVTADLAARPVFVACAWRDDEAADGPAQRELVDELAARAETWALQGLGHHDVRVLIEATVGRVADPGEARSVTERTGGNPLFVSELARLSQARGSDSATAVPASAQAATRRRVARLAQPVAEALSAASVLGASLSWRALAHLLDVSAEVLTTLVDPLLEAGLLRQQGDRFDFGHALIRDAVYDALPPARRRQLHLRVARQLERDGGGDAEVAHHLVRSVPLVGEEEVVDATERAARSAAAVHAWEDAARWCAQGLELTTTPSRRAELALLHGEMQLAMGDLDAARAQFTEAADIGRRSEDADLVARAALDFASGLSGFEVRLWDRAQTDLLTEALALRSGQESALTVLLRARLAVALSFTAPAEERRALAEDAVAMGRRVGDAASLGAALAAHCDTISGPAYSEIREAEASEVVDLARQVGDHGLELLGLRLRLMARWEQGDMAGAGLDTAAYERLVAQLRQPFYGWVVPLWRGARAHLVGDLATMTACSLEAERVGELGGSRNAAVLGVVQRAWPFFERGLPEQAMATFFEMFGELPELAGDGGSWARLFPGQPVAVHDAALENLPRMFDTLEVDSEWVTSVAAAAEAMFGRDVGHQHAGLLYDALRPYAHRYMVDGIGAALVGSVHVSLAQLASLAGEHRLADEHFTAAIAADAAIEAPLPRARAQRVQAEALRRHGDPQDEPRRRALLEESLAFYRGAGILERVVELEAALADTPDTSPATAADEAPSRGVLRREGSFWTVTWRGHQAVLPAVKGLADLAVLLGQPDREVHALDLAGAPGGRREVGGDLGPVIDETARAAYRARLARLDEELADAELVGDTDASERAARERESLLAELTSAYGLGGRARRAGDPAERARTTVTSRVRDAITRVEAQLPELGRHLRASVRTGVYCVYSPESPTVWDLAQEPPHDVGRRPTPPG